MRRNVGGAVQIRFTITVKFSLLVVNCRRVRHGKRKSVGSVRRRRHRISGQRLSVGGRRAGMVGRRVIAGVREALQVAGRPMRRTRPGCRHRGMNLPGKQSPRITDVIAGEIQHGRLLPVPRLTAIVQRRRLFECCRRLLYEWNVVFATARKTRNFSNFVTVLYVAINLKIECDTDSI